MSKKGSKKTIPNKPRQIEKILDRRIVNLSNLQLTQSETNLLRKGLNFCPTPPPPRIEDINKDIDTFARRLTLREYHTPENLDEITDSPGYQPSILQQLNQKERNTRYRPSREPYLNTYADRLRQEITDEMLHNQRFQRNNLSKRERAALDRSSNNIGSITSRCSGEELALLPEVTAGRVRILLLVLANQITARRFLSGINQCINYLARTL